MSGGARTDRLADACVYLIWTVRADDTRERDAVRSALESGAVDLVQLRAKDTPAIDAPAAWLRDLARATNTLFVMNDDPAAAVRADADGVHVGQDDAAPADAREMVGAERLVGLSTHDAREITAAATMPVDYVGLGPCFPTGSKQLTRTPGGAALVATGVEAAGALPVFPIGGITPANVEALAAAGARRAAVGAGILDAPDPAAAARRIRAVLGAGVP